jgi:thiol-disulfide isomerase/thioredoxin
MSTGNPAPATSELLIACLCAQWCGTCNDYAPLFKQLQMDYPQARLVWIDIEDEAELVDPVEVENFPTVLIATHKTARFFGTVTPHIETLRRLIDSHAAETGAGKCGAEVQALTERLHQGKSV